jgi:prophage regulatory protein
VRMKRGSQFAETARAAGVAKPQRMAAPINGKIDDDRAAGQDGATNLRGAARETEPSGAFDARPIGQLYKAAPADSKGLARTIRRRELRQIVPLADSTIYELERRGDFPKRFFLTARCVVWDLGEVLAWLQSRRQAGSSPVKKAPAPDVRKRVCRPISVKG